jgi:hypothetical protein
MVERVSELITQLIELMAESAYGGGIQCIRTNHVHCPTPLTPEETVPDPDVHLQFWLLEGAGTSI